jgi:hypothetical protein
MTVHVAWNGTGPQYLHAEGVEPYKGEYLQYDLTIRTDPEDGVRGASADFHTFATPSKYERPKMLGKRQYIEGLTAPEAIAWCEARLAEHLH